jgi:hypothetical protein
MALVVVSLDIITFRLKSYVFHVFTHVLIVPMAILALPAMLDNIEVVSLVQLVPVILVIMMMV